jgi:hypothetical protein
MATSLLAAFFFLVFLDQLERDRYQDGCNAVEVRLLPHDVTVWSVITNV